MKMPLAIYFGCMSTLLAAGAVYGHHSFVSFDMTKTVQMAGTVKEFQWTNPHTYIVLEMTDSNGRTSDATLETNGPGYLVRQGWKRETLRQGDKITVTVHPMRDGSPGGQLVGVTLPSGQQLSAELKGPRPIQAQPLDSN
jgi:hypothetical protein